MDSSTGCVEGMEREEAFFVVCPPFVSITVPVEGKGGDASKTDHSSKKENAWTQMGLGRDQGKHGWPVDWRKGLLSYVYF